MDGNLQYFSSDLPELENVSGSFENLIELLFGGPIAKEYDAWAPEPTYGILPVSVVVNATGRYGERKEGETEDHRVIPAGTPYRWRRLFPNKFWVSPPGEHRWSYPRKSFYIHEKQFVKFGYPVSPTLTTSTGSPLLR